MKLIILLLLLYSYISSGEWSKVAPLRILSFDIECAGRKGIFPEPNHDPVIQIANMCICQGSSENIFVKNVFTLNTCAPIVGSQVICCKKETELLDKWAAFVRDLDPDVFTGNLVILSKLIIISLSSRLRQLVRYNCVMMS